MRPHPRPAARLRDLLELGEQRPAMAEPTMVGVDDQLSVRTIDVGVARDLALRRTADQIGAAAAMQVQVGMLRQRPDLVGGLGPAGQGQHLLDVVGRQALVRLDRDLRCGHGRSIANPPDQLRQERGTRVAPWRPYSGPAGVQS